MAFAENEPITLGPVLVAGVEAQDSSMIQSNKDIGAR
jgi:hypothetical protein